MRLLSAIGTSVLALAIAVPVYAQKEQHEQKEEEKGKPAQENEKKAQPSKPAQQNEKNAQQQDKNTRQEEKNAQQQGRNNQQEERNAKQQEQHTQQAKPEQQAERGGHNGGGRIPDDRYRANFGREHSFRVSEDDYRNHRFQYGGYWFGFEGVWPSNWLYTQNVFVIEIDGVYYLCNPMYPGVNIALNVTL